MKDNFVHMFMYLLFIEIESCVTLQDLVCPLVYTSAVLLNYLTKIVAKIITFFFFFVTMSPNY